MRVVVTALAGTFVALFIMACGSDSDQVADVPGEAAPTARAVQATLTVGRWRLRVSVRPSRLGPVVFATNNLARATPTDSAPWIQHDLVFRNAGDEPVTFADTRSSKFTGEAGRKRLLVAEQGCGYAQNSPRAPARAGACLAYLDLVTVKPHTSAKRSVTLFKGLPGMDPLVAGAYVFRRPVRLQLGSRPPDEGEGRSAVVRVLYEIEARSG